MKVIATALILLFVLAVVVFCVQNLDGVTIAYLGWSSEVPLAGLVLLAYLLGMVTGWGVLAFLRKTIHKMREKKSSPPVTTTSGK
jgi:lipopolysaccharide assembly protein A